MTDRYRPETAAGRTFASETKGVPRALNAGKAAATRRKNREALRQKEWEPFFIITRQTAAGDDFVGRYPVEGERAVTLDSLLATWESADLWVDDGDPEGGRLMRDLAVWRGGYLLAVLKKRGDRYEAVRFDG